MLPRTYRRTSLRILHRTSLEMTRCMRSRQPVCSNLLGPGGGRRESTDGGVHQAAVGRFRGNPRDGCVTEMRTRDRDVSASPAWPLRSVGTALTSGHVCRVLGAGHRSSVSVSSVCDPGSGLAVNIAIEWHTATPRGGMEPVAAAGRVLNGSARAAVLELANRADSARV